MRRASLAKFVSFFACLTALGLAQEVPVPTPVEAPAADYRMKPGDVVDVRFFYNPEINEQNVVIRPDGKISMQLIGDVQFAGRTVEEVSQTIAAAFQKELKNPKVSIQIRGYSTQKAYVAGEVPRPGTISLNSTMTVLAAISEAGGILPRGNRQKVVLIRKMPDGKPGRKEIVLFAGKQPTPESQMELQPFDVILVPETKIARVDRWVDQFLRQTIPVNLSAGFTYLWQNNPGGGGAVIAPF
ncbi:MAG: polysaccharide biosynthesis/export family protein [Bryobacter sp.]|nr:polysaccharide biosynthesis/export family protein [Bryobacter sp.]